MTAWRSVTRVLRQRPAAEPAPPADPAVAQELAAQLDITARARLGRSLALRHVAGGGCNGCELELIALQGVLYDLQRLGLRFVESPRHADVLVCTGPLTRNLREALERTWAATPDPKWVVAVGAGGGGGGVFRGRFGGEGGPGGGGPGGRVVRGWPAAPGEILAGLGALLAANRSPIRGPASDGEEPG